MTQLVSVTRQTAKYLAIRYVNDLILQGQNPLGHNSGGAENAGQDIAGQDNDGQEKHHA